MQRLSLMLPLCLLAMMSRPPSPHLRLHSRPHRSSNPPAARLLRSPMPRACLTRLQRFKQLTLPRLRRQPLRHPLHHRRRRHHRPPPTSRLWLRSRHNSLARKTMTPSHRLARLLPHRPIPLRAWEHRRTAQLLQPLRLRPRSSLSSTNLSPFTLSNRSHKLRLTLRHRSPSSPRP